MSLLIIGGTGTLGRQIVKRALDEGYQVRCLVRNLRRSAFLKDWGAEIVYGDLAKPETIPSTLKGIRVVIDASTVRPTDDYSAEKIDWKGKIALLEAIKLGNIKKFISFSFYGAIENKDIPLLDLKLKLARAISKTNINYTVFQCAGFFQGLINQYAVPILEKQTIWLLSEMSPTAYIDTQDAAKIVIESLNVKTSYNLVGVQAWKPESIIKICERLSGQTAKISYIPNLVLNILQKFFRSLEFTWNISDRLQFSEVSKTSNKIEVSKDNSELLSLEQYLQDYFSKILKKLKETNYQQLQQDKDISFL
jgi:uncharacterized protein YbjT (DUF2867 family)